MVGHGHQVGVGVRRILRTVAARKQSKAIIIRTSAAAASCGFAIPSGERHDAESGRRPRRCAQEGYLRHELSNLAPYEPAVERDASQRPTDGRVQVLEAPR